MEQIQQTILAQLIPAYSKKIEDSLIIEHLKSPTVKLISELCGLLGLENIVIVRDKSEFMSTVVEEALRFLDATTQVINHFQHEIDQVSNYSKLIEKHKTQVISPRVGQLAKQHAESLTPQVKKLRQDQSQAETMIQQMIETLKETFDNGIADVMELRYVGSSPVQEGPLFMPKLLQTRLTEHYLPQSVQVQDYQNPSDANLKYDRYLVGIGDCGNLQYYFIFNDESKTEITRRVSNQKPKESTISRFDQISKIQIMFFRNYSVQSDGTFAGVQFQNKAGETLLNCGFSSKPNTQMYDVKEYLLDDSERILGVKSGLREKGAARHWDLQFIIGRFN